MLIAFRILRVPQLETVYFYRWLTWPFHFFFLSISLSLDASYLHRRAFWIIKRKKRMTNLELIPPPFHLNVLSGIFCVVPKKSAVFFFFSFSFFTHWISVSHDQSVGIICESYWHLEQCLFSIAGAVFVLIVVQLRTIPFNVLRLIDNRSVKTKFESLPANIWFA